MLYQNVCLEAFAYTLPDEIVTSAEIEARLEPLYRRLRLPEGRLELMTGIAQRRFWPPGMLPSEKSVETAEKAIRISGIDKQQIGALVHGSVCRDFLEPATACGVHHRLGLPNRCAVYDVSNACLGLLSGMVQAANMIELGQIRAGRGGGHRERPRLGRGDHRPPQCRHVALAQRHQGGLRLVDDRLRQRGHRALRSGTQPHRQPPAGRRDADGHRALRALPGRHSSLPSPAGRGARGEGSSSAPPC